MLPSLLLLACTGAADGDDSACPPGSHRQEDGLCHLDEDTGTAGGGALSTEGGPQAPTWSAEEVLAQLDAALAWGIADMPTIGETYAEFMEHREPTCPSMEDPDSTTIYGVWQSNACVTEEGWIYDGLAMYSGGCEGPEDNQEQPGQGYEEGGMLAQFQLTDPDGLVFLGGGSAVHSCRWYEDGSGTCFDQLGGTFAYAGAEGWLATGVEASLFVDHVWGGEQGRVTTLVGGVGYPALDLSFQDVVLDWDACEGRPTGVLRLRDPTTYWHELHFADDCSGCATMTWRDLDEGEHCYDLAAAVRPVVEAWEEPCWK